MMKNFFSQHGYTCLKLFINQFVISIFGFSLAMTTASMGNDTFSIAVSVFAVLFYIFLVYNVMWEVGAKDRLSVDLGKKKKNLSTGLLIALVASIPNFIIAILYTIGYPFMQSQEWAASLCAVVKVISLFVEGMYAGLITSISFGGVQLSNFWFTYFVIIIPTVASVWVSYFIGFSNFRFFPSFSTPKASDEKHRK